MPAIGTVGAQSFVCELTVVLPTLREEKKSLSVRNNIQRIVWWQHGRIKVKPIYK